jgi:biotin carboxylase
VTPAPIAIVDGFSTGKVLSARLRAAGVPLVHVRSSPEVADYFLRGFQPGDYLLELDGTDDVGKVADSLREHGVRRVVAGTESGVVLADVLGDALGVPGNDARTARARRDKAEMGALVRRAGLATPYGRLFDAAEEAVRWYSSSGLTDVVVKPVDSAGTDNVRFCAGEEDVREACERVLSSRNLYDGRNRTVLVQERVRGVEYYVNTVSADGVHLTAELWRYSKHASASGTPLYDFEEPVPARSEEAAAIRAFVFAALDALGVRFGAAHTEVMLTERGPVFIETGARLGGATIPGIVERFSGISQVKLFTDILLNPDALHDFKDDTVEWTAHVRNASLINHWPGPVGTTEWRSRIESLPSVVAVASAVVPGQWLEVTSDLIDSPGFVYLAADDAARVEADYRTIRTWEREGLYVDAASSPHTAGRRRPYSWPRRTA